MAMTKLDIVNRAIMLLGQGPMQTNVPSTQGGPIVQAANLFFDTIYTDMLCKTEWRFAVKQVQLSAVNADPVVPNYWQYIYELPGDFLKTVRQYPQNYNWEIYGQQIYSMLAGPIYFEYVYEIPIEECPTPFCMALYYEVATQLALTNAQNTGYAQYLQQQGMIKLAQAQAAFSQNRPQTPLASSPVLGLRFVSQTAVNG